MNVLTVPFAHGLCAPLSGAQTRLFHLVKRLTSLDASVVVLEDGRYSNSREKELVTPYYFRDIDAGNRHLVPLRDVNISYLKALFKALRNETIDIVEFSYPAGMLTAKVLIKLMGKKTPLIYHPYDVGTEFVEITIMDELYTPPEKRLLRMYIRIMEWLVCSFLADHIIAVSERDREVFINKYRLPRRKTTVIPSGIHIYDANRYTSNPNVKRDLEIDPSKIVIFFNGSYSHPANKEAIDVIKSHIAPGFEEDGRAFFLVGGTGVPKFSSSNVRSIGFIRDLPAVFANVDIAIVPVLHGGGTRLKVFDYMAARLPIVTTQKGAQGINIANREQAIIVDGVGDEFIDAITFLIDNPEERKRMGASARMLVERQYDWEKIGECLHTLYAQLSSDE
jgi:glycosyltransferase involved in cell wall biosynthesis